MSAATSTTLGFTGFLDSGSATLVDHITWLEVQLNLSATATYSGLKVSITDANKRVSSMDIIDIGFNNSDSFTGPKTFYINKSGVGFSPNIDFNFISTVAKWNIQVTVKEGTLTQNVIFTTARLALPTLSDYLITESASLQSGDVIHFTGLTVNNKPDSDPSIQIVFNQEGTQKTTDTYEVFQPLMDYNSGGNYTTAINTLPNDTVYRVEARAVWSDIETKPPQLFRNLIVIKRPEIASVTPLDIQNDGGNDGVGLTEGSSQTVLTVFLKGSDEYNNYAPHDVVFKLYLDEVEVATTSAYTFNNVKTGTQSYDIQLDQITRGDGVLPLTNGTAYTVKAELQIRVPTLLTLEDESPIDVAVTRVSEPVDVSFSQNVAPISSVTINNSWLAGGIPDINGGFGDSPVLGISGSFDKTVQFRPTYSKNLDAPAADTKFLLEYKVAEGDWSPVPSCSLIQKGDSETETAAYKRAAALLPTDSSDGLYANVVGLNSMIFFIPTTLAEGTKVSVRVSIDVARTFWKIDSAPMRGINSTTSDSVATLVSLELVNKVGEYDFTIGEVSEPFNSTRDVATRIPGTWAGDLLQTVNGVQSLFAAASVIADSTVDSEGRYGSMVTPTSSGWGIQSDGTTSRKVNLYFYSNPNTVLGANLELSTLNQTEANSFKLSQRTGLGIYAVIDRKATDVQMPFLVVYTAPTRTGTNKRWWAKSTLVYAKNENYAVGAFGPTLLYTGTDDSLMFPEILSTRRRKLELTTIPSDIARRNDTFEDELVLRVNISTTGNTISDFTLLEVGVELDTYGVDMKFSNLLLDIPVDMSFSSYANSSRVHPAGKNLGADVVTAKGSTPSISVVPQLNNSLEYAVTYSITDPNNFDAVVWGLPISKTVPNKYFPVKADFTVSDFSFKTVNNNSESSISFKLDILNPAALDRIDGVNAYITYTDASSDVQTKLIGPYSTDATDVLLDFAEWPEWSSAEISFVAFRDARVSSTGGIIEIASSKTVMSLLVDKVPVIEPVSGIALAGGIVGETTTLSWAELAATPAMVVMIGDEVQNTTYKDLTIAANGSPNAIDVKVKFVGAVSSYYSKVKTIKFVSGSVNVSGMVVTVDFAKSTDKYVEVTVGAVVTSGMVVDQKLTDDGTDLTINGDGYELINIASKLKMAISASVAVTETLDSVVSELDSTIFTLYGPVTDYVARPSAAGVGIAFAGGYRGKITGGGSPGPGGSSNSSARITLSNMDADSNSGDYVVYYKLSIPNAPRSDTFTIKTDSDTGIVTGEAFWDGFVSPTPYILHIQRVFKNVWSEPDEITFINTDINSYVSITVDNSSTTSKLFATYDLDTITSNVAPFSPRYIDAGLYANNAQLNKNNDDSYDIESYSAGTYLTLVLKIKAAMDYKLNGTLKNGDESSEFVGSYPASYIVSSYPAVTDIIAGVGKINMNLNLNGAIATLIFLVTQDGSDVNRNGKEYLLRFNNVWYSEEQDQDTTLTIGNAGFSSGSGWKFACIKDDLSTLTPPNGALLDGNVNVLAIANTTRGTDMQVSEVYFEN